MNSRVRECGALLMFQIVNAYGIGSFRTNVTKGSKTLLTGGAELPTKASKSIKISYMGPGKLPRQVEWQYFALEQFFPPDAKISESQPNPTGEVPALNRTALVDLRFDRAKRWHFFESQDRDSSRRRGSIAERLLLSATG
jgi:hypothetical protein